MTRHVHLSDGDCDCYYRKAPSIEGHDDETRAVTLRELAILSAEDHWREHPMKTSSMIAGWLGSVHNYVVDDRWVRENVERPRVP